MSGAGSLRDEIVIQAPATETDAAGQPLDTWTDVCRTRASIRHQSGMQVIRADADVSIVTASIRIRRRAGITAGMRVLHGTAAYDIQSILPDEGRVWMDLVCRGVS